MPLCDAQPDLGPKYQDASIYKPDPFQKLEPPLLNEDDNVSGNEETFDSDGYLVRSSEEENDISSIPLVELVSLLS